MLANILKQKPSNIPFHRYTPHKFSTSWWMVELSGEKAPIDFNSFKLWCLDFFGLDEAGVQYLFSSKWQVDDSSSSSLCERIHTVINHGTPVVS